MNLVELLALIEKAKRHDPRKLNREEIPTEPGIYVWYSRRTGRPVYVGKAAGKNGIRGRICAQHLNAGYLLGNSEKMTDADNYQRNFAVLVGEKSYIDKSAFRRNIGRRHSIAPGQGTVDYIRKVFSVIWVVLPVPEIAELERQLIVHFANRAVRGEMYNISGMPR